MGMTTLTDEYKSIVEEIKEDVKLAVAFLGITMFGVVYLVLNSNSNSKKKNKSQEVEDEQTKPPKLNCEDSNPWIEQTTPPQI